MIAGAGLAGATPVASTGQTRGSGAGKDTRVRKRDVEAATGVGPVKKAVQPADGRPSVTSRAAGPLPGVLPGRPCVRGR